MLTQEFAARPALIRSAIHRHTEWIGKSLGVSVSDALILQCDMRVIDAAIPHLFGNIDFRGSREKPVRLFMEAVESVTVPPSYAPLLQADYTTRPVDLMEALSGHEARGAYCLEWDDCPVAFRLRGIASPLIALAVSYHAGPDSVCENTARVLIFRRDAVEQVLQLLARLSKSDGQPRLHTHNSVTQPVQPCDWGQLVLDPNIVSLLKNDFESFLQRKDWFRKMRLPFRRGYLLHGPPGNGKSTAIRAMLTSAGLTAYTLRLFDSQVDDGDLDRVFERAVKHAPGIILLEDLDRCFPKTGESRSKVSLQQLLNCLDGVGTGEGIVTVATANEPTILDPAILRRPGRFDRVVYFPNPSAVLRREYFCRMHAELAAADLDPVVSDSDGFSFAQLRESYIMAGQLAFEADREICVEDLSAGARSLRQTTQLSSKRNNRAGFISSP
jgi:ATPase family associated with various cellular activities (AAA)